MTDNELIAEFLEWKPDKVHGQKGAWKPTAATPEFIGLYSLRLFEESWDWLMPVVEALHEPVVNDGKIIRSGCEITIYYKACKLEFTPDEDFEDIEDFEVQTKGETKLEAVYKAVVEFIKWYNQTRKQ